MAQLTPAGDEIACAPDEQARALFAESPLPLWVYDLETLRFLDVNEVACRKYGYTREEFLAMTIRDIRPPEDVGAMEESVRVQPAEVFNAGIWRHLLKDGTAINVEITSHELVFRGRRTRFVCPIDVTQRVRAEAALREREAALRRAQELARLGHVVTGPDGGFESWSESLPGLAGVAPADMPRSTRAWLGLLHPDDRATFRARSIEAAQAGTRVDVEYRMPRPDGALAYMRQVIEPIVEADGAARGRWFSTIQDVTAQKLAELQVLQANEDLERRVEQRTLELELSNRQLALATAAAERANRAKSEFLSNMSHELRTPLNAIIGFGQLLAMPEVMARDAGQRQVFVDHIVDAGRHLLTLINEILNLAQIEAGKVELNLENVPLGALLAECSAMLDQLAAQRGIAMQFPARCEVELRADRMRLKQVLLNLLSNAIKYNRDGGTVRVDCLVRGGRARVHVRDTGRGLAPEQLAALFQPFNRLGQEAGPTEGSGIGLVVTKRLVELMDGEIGVESTPGAGSLFYVELPVAEPVADGRARAFSVRAAAPEVSWPAGVGGVADSPGRATVLCVDDDPASLRLVQQVLSVLPNLHLLSASNGRLGVEMARAHAPALIVMDNNMPEMSGREAQALLRADPRTAAIPVIALSANAMPGAADASLAAGFFRYLTKPFDVGELLRAVGEALAPPARES
jgi:PAS domain S-box-containing protein